MVFKVPIAVVCVVVICVSVCVCEFVLDCVVCVSDDHVLFFWDCVAWFILLVCSVWTQSWSGKATLYSICKAVQK